MREISLIKQNILQYLDFKGISKYEFYQKTGISNGILSKNNGISEDSMLKFLSYYTEVNPEWLLTGQGEMLKKESTNKQEEVSYNVGNDKKIDIVNELAPIYNTAQNLSSIIDDKNKIIAGYEFRFASLEKDLEDCRNEKKILQNNRTPVL